MPHTSNSYGVISVWPVGSFKGTGRFFKASSTIPVPFSIWRSGRERCHEATSSGVGVGNHLYHHLVATGYERSRSECATETPDALAIGVAVVHVHEVIATQVVILQIYESKIQNDHFALRNCDFPSTFAVWRVHSRKTFTANKSRLSGKNTATCENRSLWGLRPGQLRGGQKQAEREAGARAPHGRQLTAASRPAPAARYRVRRGRREGGF